MELKITKDSRTVLSSELLNENTLLVVSKEKDKNPKVSVCYINKKQLKEDVIAELDERTSIERTERIVAVFKEVTCLGIPRLGISTIYDFRYHKFVGQDMLNTVYKIRTREDQKVKQLVNKGGLLTWQTM